MRRLIVSFLLGAIIGVTLGIAVYHLALREMDQVEAVETLDFLIGEWSASRDLTIAGFPSRMELPDARPGFFPDTVRSLARRVETNYNVPRSVTLSQWALESRWGLSNLGASNYFGHTYEAVHRFMPEPKYVIRPERVIRNDSIVVGPAVRFANYKNIAESFDVHGKYLSRSIRYASAFKTGSPERFARTLSRAGYATDPDYGLKLVAIMRRYRLNNANAQNF